MLIRHAKIDLFLTELLREELYKYIGTYTTKIYILKDIKT